jgi:hypothetical protein
MSSNEVLISPMGRAPVPGFGTHLPRSNFPHGQGTSPWLWHPLAPAALSFLFCSLNNAGRFCGFLAADGAERNFDLSSGALFPRH